MYVAMVTVILSHVVHVITAYARAIALVRAVQKATRIACINELVGRGVQSMSTRCSFGLA